MQNFFWNKPSDLFSDAATYIAIASTDIYQLVNVSAIIDMRHECLSCYIDIRLAQIKDLKIFTVLEDYPLHGLCI